jgi:hypothetical protein
MDNSMNFSSCSTHSQSLLPSALSEPHNAAMDKLPELERLPELEKDALITALWTPPFPPPITPANRPSA